jgi:hypothetical protein
MHLLRMLSEERVDSVLAWPFFAKATKAFFASNGFFNGLPFAAFGTEAKNGGTGGIAFAALRPSQVGSLCSLDLIGR